MVTYGTHTLTIAFCANIHHHRFIHFITASFPSLFLIKYSGLTYWPINNYCFCNKTS